jgi:hypothetical protein
MLLASDPDLLQRVVRISKQTYTVWSATQLPSSSTGYQCSWTGHQFMCAWSIPGAYREVQDCFQKGSCCPMATSTSPAGMPRRTLGLGSNQSCNSLSTALCYARAPQCNAKCQSATCGCSSLPNTSGSRSSLDSGKAAHQSWSQLYVAAALAASTSLQSCAAADFPSLMLDRAAMSTMQSPIPPSDGAIMKDLVHAAQAGGRLKRLPAAHSSSHFQIYTVLSGSEGAQDQLLLAAAESLQRPPPKTC